MKNLLPVLFLLLLCGNRATAQLPGMRKYTQLDGLTGTNCYAISQDKRGFLWVGTDNGGVCFDGKKFTSLQAGKMSDADILSCSPLGDDRILLVPITGGIYILEKGRILTRAEVPALNGLEQYDHRIPKYDPLTGTYWLSNNYRSGEAYACRADCIRAYPVGRSTYVFYAYGGRLLGCDVTPSLQAIDPVSGRRQPLYWENGQKVFWSSKALLSPQEHFNGYFSFPSGRYLNLYRYIPDDSVLHFCRSFLLPPDQGQILDVMVDHNRQVWIRYEGKGGVFYLGSLLPGAAAGPLLSMKLMAVNSLFMDRNSNIWISSPNNALYFLSRQHFVNLLLSARFASRQEIPLSLSGNGQGDLLIGYSASARLSYVHAQKHRTIRLNDYFREGIRKILHLGDNRYLICSREIALFNSRKGTISYMRREGVEYCKNLCLYGEQGLLVALSSAVRYYPSIPDKNKSTNIFTGRSTSIAVLSDKRILIGTQKGLYLQQYLGDSSRKVNDPVLRESSITDLLALPDSSVLVGTSARARGLYRYRPGDRAVVLRNKEEKPRHIRSLYRQNDSIYWVASDEGAWRLVFGSRGTLAGMTNYTFYDGLPSNNVNSVYVCRDTAYVATTEGMGVILINDKDSLQSQMPPPDIYLNSVQAGQVSYRHPNRLVLLEHNQNNLLASFSAISYESLGNVHFYYRLYPYQAQWIHTTDPEVRFTRVPPGDYVLEAYALNAKGAKSKQTIALEIRIRPAFWQTWYFKVSAVVLVLLLGYRFLRRWLLRRDQKKIEQVQQKKRLAELELEAIKAQINPHFIYNCLNSIQYLNYSSEHQQAQHYLDLFARLIRMTMQYSQQTFISLEEEIDYLSRYLQLEQLRFKEKLSYEISVADDFPANTLLPAMLVQPYVENAVKHGIAGKEQGRIDIRFDKQEGNFRITVADNGSGFRSLSRQGALGMRISGTRAQSYNKLFNLSIRIDRYNRQDLDPAATGAVVQITIPPINYGNIMQSSHH